MIKQIYKNIIIKEYVHTIITLIDLILYCYRLNLPSLKYNLCFYTIIYKYNVYLKSYL
jgi:hypothetical protein